MKVRWALIWLLTILYFSNSAWADTRTQAFLDGVQSYKSGQYQKAIDTFKRLADDGNANAKLYYNLGNAYLKAEDIGHAILWYERAQKLNGSDPDLIFNLSYARSLAKDVDTSKSGGVHRILFFWKYQLSRQTILAIALVCNGIFWFLLILRTFLRSKRKALGVGAAVVALPMLVFICTALYNYYETAQTPQAVILPGSVSVRSGLSDNATELFVLHAGTVVKVQKRQGEFLRISYTKDKIGWLKQSQVGII